MASRRGEFWNIEERKKLMSKGRNLFYFLNCHQRRYLNIERINKMIVIFEENFGEPEFLLDYKDEIMGLLDDKAEKI